jgi:hypothetical protein
MQFQNYVALISELSVPRCQHFGLDAPKLAFITRSVERFVNLDRISWLWNVWLPKFLFEIDHKFGPIVMESAEVVHASPRAGPLLFRRREIALPE